MTVTRTQERPKSSLAAMSACIGIWVVVGLLVAIGAEITTLRVFSTQRNPDAIRLEETLKSELSAARSELVEINRQLRRIEQTIP